MSTRDEQVQAMRRAVQSSRFVAYQPDRYLVPLQGLTCSMRDFAVEDYEPTPASDQPRKRIAFDQLASLTKAECDEWVGQFCRFPPLNSMTH